MNQKLSDWASIAEIISGIAVVITLVFLVFGIQDNTATTRTAVYADIIDSFNTLELTLLEDPELDRLFGAYVAQDSSNLGTLNESERDRLRRIALIQFRNYEKAFFARQYGVIGDAEWNRVEAGICSNYERTLVIDMRLVDMSIFTEDFRNLITSRCEGARP